MAENDDKLKARAHYEEGRRLWALGRHGEAMTEFNRAIALDPESPAKTAVEMSQTIMDFFDRQQFNP